MNNYVSWWICNGRSWFRGSNVNICNLLGGLLRSISLKHPDPVRRLVHFLAGTSFSLASFASHYGVRFVPRWESDLIPNKAEIQWGIHIFKYLGRIHQKPIINQQIGKSWPWKDAQDGFGGRHVTRRTAMCKKPISQVKSTSKSTQMVDNALVCKGKRGISAAGRCLQIPIRDGSNNWPSKTNQSTRYLSPK